MSLKNIVKILIRKIKYRKRRYLFPVTLAIILAVSISLRYGNDLYYQAAYNSLSINSGKPLLPALDVFTFTFWASIFIIQFIAIISSIFPVLKVGTIDPVKILREE